MKIEVFEGNSSGVWYWHVVARNGKLVADSEAYNRRADAIRAAKQFVRGVIRPFAKSFPLTGAFTDPIFTEKVTTDNVTTIRWQ